MMWRTGTSSSTARGLRSITMVLGVMTAGSVQGTSLATPPINRQASRSSRTWQVVYPTPKVAAQEWAPALPAAEVAPRALLWALESQVNHPISQDIGLKASCNSLEVLGTAESECSCTWQGLGDTGSKRSVVGARLLVSMLCFGAPKAEGA
eukprot:1161520-Pelagomonas_calceolata.AAC.3